MRWEMFWRVQMFLGDVLKLIEEISSAWWMGARGLLSPGKLISQHISVLLQVCGAMRFYIKIWARTVHHFNSAAQLPPFLSLQIGFDGMNKKATSLSKTLLLEYKPLNKTQWLLVPRFIAQFFSYLQQKTHLLAQARLGVVSMHRWDSIP